MEWPFNRGRTLNRLSAIAWPAATMIGVFLTSMIGIAATDGCSIVSDGLVLPSAGACVEFWLARYQALLSALIALGAAAYTARLVITQLTEMRAQRALQAYDAAKRELADIQEEGRLLSQLMISSGYMAQFSTDIMENSQLPQSILKYKSDALEKHIKERRKLLFEIDTFRAKCLHDHDDRRRISAAMSAALDTNTYAYDVLALCIPIDADSIIPAPAEIQIPLIAALRQLDKRLAAERSACDTWENCNLRREFATKELALRYKASAFRDVVHDS